MSGPYSVKEMDGYWWVMMGENRCDGAAHRTREAAEASAARSNAYVSQWWPESKPPDEPLPLPRPAPRPSDSEILDWLEAQFSGTFRNSIFWGHDIDGSGMLNFDLRSQPGVGHRAKTVRGLLALAMGHASKANTSSQATKPAPDDSES